jgi:Tol biopolymer transport system component
VPQSKAKSASSTATLRSVDRSSVSTMSSATGQIVFTVFWQSSGTQFGQLHVVDGDGSNQHTLMPHYGTEDSDPSWSPDGTKIAFVSDHGYTSGNAFTNLFTVNADGTNIIPLTNDTGANGTSNIGCPTWSPNGRKIAFEKRISSSQTGFSSVTDIYVKDLDNMAAAPVKLTTGTLAEDYRCPAWSPDGAQLAYTKVYTGSSGSSVGDIYVMNPDGTNPLNLTADYTQPIYPRPDWINPVLAWSHNSAKIAFQLHAGLAQGLAYKYEIAVMDRNGSNKRQVTAYATDSIVNYFPVGAPTWSPDNTQIAFSYRGELRAVSATATQPLTDTPGAYTQLTNLGGGATMPDWGQMGAAMPEDWYITCHNLVVNGQLGRMRVYAQPNSEETDGTPIREIALFPPGMRVVRINPNQEFTDTHRDGRVNEAHPQQAAGYRSLNTQFRSKLRGIRPTLD